MGINIGTIEIGEDIRLNLFVYGMTGAGKTTFLGSARLCQYTAPTLLLDVEGGSVSLSGTGIDIVRPQSMVEVQEIYDFFRHDNKKYQSVSLDSITELQRKLSMGEIIGVLEEGSVYTHLADHTPPRQYDWLSSGEQVRRTIRAFRDLAYLPEVDRRVHVLFSALEKLDEKKNTVCPSLPGQLGLEVGASVDLLGRLSIRTTESEDSKVERRYMSLRQYEDDDGVIYLGKVRAPEGAKFPRGVYNPTVDRMVRLWMSREPAPEPGPKPKLRKRR